MESCKRGVLLSWLCPRNKDPSWSVCTICSMIKMKKNPTQVANSATGNTVEIFAREKASANFSRIMGSKSKRHVAKKTPPAKQFRQLKIFWRRTVLIEWPPLPILNGKSPVNVVRRNKHTIATPFRAKWFNIFTKKPFLEDFLRAIEVSEEHKSHDCPVSKQIQPTTWSNGPITNSLGQLLRICLGLT